MRHDKARAIRATARAQASWNAASKAAQAAMEAWKPVITDAARTEAAAQAGCGVEYERGDLQQKRKPDMNGAADSSRNGAAEPARNSSADPERHGDTDTDTDTDTERTRLRQETASICRRIADIIGLLASIQGDMLGATCDNMVTASRIVGDVLRVQTMYTMVVLEAPAWAERAVREEDRRHADTCRRIDNLMAQFGAGEDAAMDAFIDRAEREVREEGSSK